MKKVIAIVFALAFSMSSYADQAKLVGSQKFVIPDGDVYGQLCLAALDSKYVLEQRAQELGVSKSTMKNITCNGLSLVRFAKTYRGDIQEWFVAQRN